MPYALPRAPLSGADTFAVEYDPVRHEVIMLDQRKLPGEVVYHRLHKPDEVAEAIRAMIVRGAPAIGIAAAYGLALQAHLERGSSQLFLLANGVAGRVLSAARPTAVNLAWAVARMARQAGAAAALDPEARYRAMLAEAEAIHRDDVEACRRIGELGATLVPEGATILTHCNAGALATGGYGTALGVIRAAHAQGKRVRVLAGETRPYLQGARLTAWELHRDQIPVEVITDNMAGHFFQRGEIQLVVVGADRVAKNGDVANKIGTYSIAVLARAHGAPFTVAAPWSTVDLHTPDGAAIPIEERASSEVTKLGSTLLVGEGIHARHPAFDVTPARFVDALITERGIVHPGRGEEPALLLKEPASRA